MNQFKANRHLKNVEFLAKLLDTEFNLGPFKFGLDPLIGLIPWIGDIFSAVISLYIYWIAREFNIPKAAQNRILLNTVIDFIIGFIPIVGDVADFIYQSNKANMKILKFHIEKLS